MSLYLGQEYADKLLDYYGMKEPRQAVKKQAVKPKSAPKIDTPLGEIKSLPLRLLVWGGGWPQSKDFGGILGTFTTRKSLITEIPKVRWAWQNYYEATGTDKAKTNSKWGGFIEDVDKFDAGFFNISPREAELMDPQHRLFLQSVWEAVESSGYDPLSWRGRNVGVFAGVQFQRISRLIQEAGISDPYSATGNSHAMLANRCLISWTGMEPSEAIDTACSSALVAINRAIQAIKTQECEIAIAGGVSLALSPKTYLPRVSWVFCRRQEGAKPLMRKRMVM